MKWKDIHFLSRFWKRRRKTSEYPRNSEHTLYSRLWVWSLCLMLWTWALVLGMNVHINKEIFNLTQCLTGFLTDCFEESRQLERLTDLSVFKNRREESNNHSCVCAGQAQGTARGRQVWTHWVCPRPQHTPPHPATCPEHNPGPATSSQSPISSAWLTQKRTAAVFNKSLGVDISFLTTKTCFIATDKYSLFMPSANEIFLNLKCCA